MTRRLRNVTYIALVPPSKIYVAASRYSCDMVHDIRHKQNSDYLILGHSQSPGGISLPLRDRWEQ